MVDAWTQTSDRSTSSRKHGSQSINPGTQSMVEGMQAGSILSPQTDEKRRPALRLPNEIDVPNGNLSANKPKMDSGSSP